MEAIINFFSLSNDATETEVHDAIEGQKPLAEQLQEARLEAETKNADAIAALTARIAALEAVAEQTATDIADKDARIAELEAQAVTVEQATQQHAATVADLKKTHDKEVRALAGQVSALKAGRKYEQDENGEPHPADVQTKSKTTVYALAESELATLVKKNRNN